MTIDNKIKKLIIFLLITAVFAGYFAFAPAAFAFGDQGQSSTGSQGGVMKWLFSSVLGWPLDAIASGLIDGIVALAELIRNAIFAGPVLIVAILFDYAVWFNVTKSILNVEAVQQAWGVMQGLANMFFILILLWIALATIFDFQEYTAKNLLPKLIIMALLINFSLVLTGVIVDFSNGLGDYFYKQITGGGSFFVQIMNNLSVSRLFNYNNQSPGGATVEQREKKISPAVDPFKAVGLTPVEPKLQSAANKEKEKLAGALYSPGQSTFAAISRLVALIMTTVLGIIMIVVLVFGIGFLIARQVTIMFLGIFSPLVFLANILPQTKVHWDNWWKSLTNQAFFAPAYLFCLLATFKFLELAKNNIYTENSSGGIAALNFAQASAFDVGFLFFYFLAAAMMIASLIVAQKMSIALGGAAMGLAKKTQGYMKTALKEQGAKMAAGTAGKFLGSGASAAMTRMPILRNIPQAAVQIQAAEQKRAQERAQLYAKLSAGDIDRNFSKYTATEQKELVKLLGQDADKKGAVAAKMLESGNIHLLDSNHQKNLLSGLKDEERKSMIDAMLLNDTFGNLSRDGQKAIMEGLKSFIPEAELAARGVNKNEARYDSEMRRLIVEKSRELANIRPESLDNVKVRDALKRVGTSKDWENIASTMRGADKMVNIWQGDIQRAASRGQNMSELIQQDYGNTELSNYANTNPLFKAVIGGQIVRPQKQKRQGGQQQQGGGQQGGPQRPTPQTPSPTPPSPRGTSIGRPAAQYAGPTGGIPPTSPTPPPGASRTPIAPPTTPIRPSPPPLPPPPIGPSPEFEKIKAAIATIKDATKGGPVAPTPPTRGPVGFRPPTTPPAPPPPPPGRTPPPPPPGGTPPTP